MDLEMMQYLEINFFGVVILLTMWFFIVRLQRDTQHADQQLFVRMLLCNIGVLLSDTVILLLRLACSPTLILLNYAVCFIYFTLHADFGYLWLSYCVKRLFPERAMTRLERVLMYIPFFINLLLVASSPWSHLVYYVDAANVYHRGVFMVPVMMLSYLYWGISAVLVAEEWLRRSRLRERSLYVTLLFFPIPTVVGNLLQLKYYGLSVVWVCSAVSLLILFINIQNYQVSRDVLTGLFNRRQTNKHIEWELQGLTERSDFLFAILADVDQFKRINDRFGHLVGDEALCAVAQLLRQSFRAKDFIARFGGDEFLVVGYVDDPSDLAAMVERVRVNFEQWNSVGAVPYRLQLSAGYAIYGRDDVPTLDRVISDADRIMYRVKESKLTLADNEEALTAAAEG